MEHKILLMLVLALSPLVLQLFILPPCNAYSDPDNSRRPHAQHSGYPAHNNGYEDDEDSYQQHNYRHHETFEQCLSAISGKHSSPLLLFPDSRLYADNIK